MEREKNLKDLNNILFEQLEILTKTSVKDDDFENVRLKADSVVEMADRIIRNSELELRNQVWLATRRFSLSTREPVKTALQIGVNDLC